MESFVPFAGLFSTPSDFKSPLSGVYQCTARCLQCNERCEEEMISLSKEFSSSIADQCQSSLPSWLQMTETGTNKGLDRKVCTALKPPLNSNLGFGSVYWLEKAGEKSRDLI